MVARNLPGFPLAAILSGGGQAMAKFRLRDNVRRIGQQEIRTVTEVRANPEAETMYWIQLGSNCASRLWAKESELEPVSAGNRAAMRPVGPGNKPLVKKA